MIVSKITEAVIYESPDGGKTVYVREPGQDPKTRTLTWESDEAKDIHKELQETQLWQDIRAAAKTNPTLAGILEQAVMVYNLSK